MKLPDGLQQHALYTMDGRTWIEPYFPPTNELQQRMHDVKIERGWMRLLPEDWVAELVNRVLG